MGQASVPIVSAAAKKAQHKRVQTIEEGLTPDGAALLAWVRQWAHEADALALKRAWALGKRINRAAADRGKYGERIVDNLAQCTGMDTSTLWKAAHFQRDFDEAALTKLIDGRFEGSGAPLTLPHVYRLMTVEDVAKRDVFLQKTLANDWTPDMLAAAIRVYLNRAPHAGGRSVQVPPTVAGKLDNLDKVLAVYNRNHTVIYANEEKGILANINDMPPDKITAELVQKFDASLAFLDEASANIASERKLLVKAKEVAVKRLAAQAEADANGDAEHLAKADK